MNGKIPAFRGLIKAGSLGIFHGCPLLQTADPRARIEELMRQRAPLYEEVAHITVETGRPNVQSVVQNILSQLELSGWPTGAAASTDSA